MICLLVLFPLEEELREQQAYEQVRRSRSTDEERGSVAQISSSLGEAGLPRPRAGLGLGDTEKEGRRNLGDWETTGKGDVGVGDRKLKRTMRAHRAI